MLPPPAVSVACSITPPLEAIKEAGVNMYMLVFKFSHHTHVYYPIQAKIQMI